MSDAVYLFISELSFLKAPWPQPASKGADATPTLQIDFYTLIYELKVNSNRSRCHCLSCRMAQNRIIIMCFLLCFPSKGPWTWPLLSHKGCRSFLRLPRQHMKTNSCFTNIFPASSIDRPFSSWPHLKMNCSCSSCGFYLAAPLHRMDPHYCCLLLNCFALLWWSLERTSEHLSPPQTEWEEIGSVQPEGRLFCPQKEIRVPFIFAVIIFIDLILNYGFLG